MEDIIRYIENEKWQEAAEAVLQELEQGHFTDTLAVLAATVNEHLGDEETMLAFIEKGLQYNYRNYELYLMLGNYFALSNQEQAYICYKNAMYYCEEDKYPEDYQYISQVFQNFASSHSIVVKKYSFVSWADDAEKMRRLLDSIREFCIPGDYEVIVVAPFMKAVEMAWLKQEEAVKLVIADDNYTETQGYNLGIAEMNYGNDIMLLSAHSIMMPNAMFALQMGLYESKQNGAVGSMLNKNTGNMYRPVAIYQSIEQHFDSIEECKEFARKNNTTFIKNYEYKTCLDGFAMLLRRDIFDEIGGLDDTFSMEESACHDLCMRLLYGGYRNVLCHNCFIFNEVQYDAYDMDLNNKLAKDERAFQEKWNINLQYYMGVREDLIRFMLDERTKPIHVLEVGCGSGATLGRIQYLYPNSKLYGIELMEPIAKLGQAGMNIICGNIEQMELPYPTEYFDYIIFGDVLEHLMYPEKVLDKIREYLKPGASVIASIPNLMNAEVIYKLLHGSFTYEPSGIRDITHLRFFTYTEILKMFARVGYQVSDIRVSWMKEHMTDSFGDFFEQLLAIDGVAERQYFDAFQYLLRAEKI